MRGANTVKLPVASHGIFEAACELRRPVRKAAGADVNKGNAPLSLITASVRHAFIPAANGRGFCREFRLIW